MKSTLLVQFLKFNYTLRQPTYIMGSPGIGKSDIVRQAARELGIELIDVRLSQLDPVDLRGLPAPNGEYIKWLIPGFLPRQGHGILFLDEFNASNSSIQAASYQLLNDGKLGDYVLPGGYVVFAAGNLETDRAITTRMSTATASRFCHVQLEVDVESWVDWALSNGIRTEVVAFIRFRPELLHKFDPASAEKAQPEPRGWQWVSKMVAAKPPDDIAYDLYSGRVGVAAASEFVGFLKIYKSLPNPMVILKNPLTADVPTDPAVMYALTGALSNLANINTVQSIVDYSIRYPYEYSTLMESVLSIKNKDIIETAAFIKLASHNSKVTI